MTTPQKIRSTLFCENCKNCKLVIWNENSQMKRLEKSGYNESAETKSIYIMRCGWLKQNMINPDKITHCEGKQLHDNKADEDE